MLQGEHEGRRILASKSHAMGKELMPILCRLNPFCLSGLLVGQAIAGW